VQVAELAESRRELSMSIKTTSSSSSGLEKQKKKKTKGSNTISNSRMNHVTTISVDVSNIVESVKRDDVQVGAWLNVLGYIRQENNAPGAESVGHPSSHEAA
jgi:hypothetical protein